MEKNLIARERAGNYTGWKPYFEKQKAEIEKLQQQLEASKAREAELVEALELSKECFYHEQFVRFYEARDNVLSKPSQAYENYKATEKVLSAAKKMIASHNEECRLVEEGVLPNGIYPQVAIDTDNYFEEVKKRIQALDNLKGDDNG